METISYQGRVGELSENYFRLGKSRGSTRRVQEVSDFGPEIKQLCTFHFFYLITLKILLLGLHTRLPTVLPLLVTPVEIFFWGVVELCRRFPYNFLLRLKTLPLQLVFQFREQHEVTWCHVWRVGRMPNTWSVVSDQATMDQLGIVSRSIVLVKL